MRHHGVAGFELAVGPNFLSSCIPQYSPHAGNASNSFELFDVGLRGRLCNIVAV